MLSYIFLSYKLVQFSITKGRWDEMPNAININHPQQWFWNGALKNKVSGMVWVDSVDIAYFEAPRPKPD